MSDDKRTPIGVFAYSRPENLRLALESLGRCDGYDDFDLHIYCDAPFKAKDAPGVEAARAVAREWIDAHGGKLIEREQNLRFRNIVNGVTELCERYGRVVVVEDDLVVSPDFLTYMRKGLDRYEDEPRVYGIMGSVTPADYPPGRHSFFLPSFSAWGWATWRRAWDEYEWSPTDWEEVLAGTKARHRFNLGGCRPYYKRLRRVMAGQLDTWDIQWYYAVFRAGGLSLFPCTSLVWNTGYGQGVHASGGRSVNEHSPFFHGNQSIRDFTGPRLPADWAFPEHVATDSDALASMCEHAVSSRPSLACRVTRRLRRLLRRQQFPAGERNSCDRSSECCDG